jgi:hypothetical protein
MCAHWCSVTSGVHRLILSCLPTVNPAVVPAPAAGDWRLSQAAAAWCSARAEEQGLQERHHVWLPAQQGAVRGPGAAAGADGAVLLLRTWQVGSDTALTVDKHCRNHR